MRSRRAFPPSKVEARLRGLISAVVSRPRQRAGFTVILLGSEYGGLKGKLAGWRVQAFFEQVMARNVPRVCVASNPMKKALGYA